MFGWWCLSFLWFGGFVATRGQLRNWAHAECPLLRAEWVWAWAPEVEEVLVVKPSFWAKVAGRLRQSLGPAAGHAGNLPVVVAAGSGTRYFVFRCCRHTIDPSTGAVYKAEQRAPPPPASTAGQAAAAAGPGLSAQEHAARLDAVGPNSIAFRVDSLLLAASKEFLSGFYFYQLLIYSGRAHLS